jgi:hypothetical protein
MRMVASQRSCLAVICISLWVILLRLQKEDSFSSKGNYKEMTSFVKTVSFMDEYLEVGHIQLVSGGERDTRRTSFRSGIKLTKDCLLSSLLHTKIGLSIRNGVLLYKQLIRPMMDYACPIWRSAACTHLKKLQVIQSKCLRIATGVHWYISNVQIHADLGVPFFVEHVRALTESYDSNLGDVGNPLFQQLGRYLR